jgi:enoyl-CoA hydratase
MGGGVGVSVHGSHRVVTERVSFAMPETGIGLFPDVGGSYFLSRRPGRLGLYMALTGARLRAADAQYVRVGDVEVAAERQPALIDALCAVDRGGDARAAVTAAIAPFAAPRGEAPLAARRSVIDETFGGGSVEEILRALAGLGDDWGRETAETIERKSPTSLKIAFRQLREGAGKSFNDCMRMEYRIASGCIAGHDFYEGVRAVVIDKDQSPRWRPASLAAVSDAEIAPYFEREPPDGDLGDLPAERD